MPNVKPKNVKTKSKESQKENKIVLDACALLAFFYNEKEGLLVKEYLEQCSLGKLIVYIHEYTLGEVLYNILLDTDLSYAEVLEKKINPLGLIIVSNEQNLLQIVVDLKVKVEKEDSLSFGYADSWVAATAIYFSAKLLTKDKHFLLVKDQCDVIIM
jgi:PIN domain nuclease of toxin-antitoxin system